MYENDSHNYNKWVLLINEETFKGIDGYFRKCNLHKVYTVYTFVFPEPLRYLAFLTHWRFKDMEAHFYKGSASYTAFGVYTVCWYFPHRYQALFSLHITDVPSSQNASLYLCSQPVCGVLFWVLFPGDHCIFSFVFCLFWPLVFILRATKLSEYPTAPSEKLHLTTFSIY